MNTCNKAITILEKTNDGNDLSPQDLSLLEVAVNGRLTESGQVSFENLYNRVLKGTYKPQWLNGVEHITRDHRGCIYWKGQHVEHHGFPWCYSPEAKQETIKLAERCKHLEEIGVIVNLTNIIWQWEKYENIKNQKGVQDEIRRKIKSRILSYPA
ncbi:MAG: hypothetical protein AABX82_08425 [Nanoarchaeota archaeon]